MESNNSIFQVNIDQDRWVIQIRQGLYIHDQENEDKEFRISVFNVPNELLEAKPEAYIPQCVSIGPYHHWRSMLHEMERYKVAAARRFQKRIMGQNFESVVEEARKWEWQIRNCYHKYLDYNEEALAWLMALDASFVLECLQFYVKNTNPKSSELKQLSKVLDPYGRSALHNAILRDLMMLENQVPLFLLQKLLEMQLGSQDKAEERLCNLVTLACEEWSPFMFKIPDSSRLLLKDRGHILETLYYLIVPADPVAVDDNIPKGGEDEEMSLPDTTYIKGALISLWNALSSLDIGPVRFLKELFQRVFEARAVQLAIKLPLCLLPIVENLPILRVFIAGKDEANKTDKDGSSVESPPTRNELAIPSVADLYSAGVRFIPTEGDLTTIRFDHKTSSLYLPKVKLDANTEVVLRNLVAFEASAAPGAFIFTRYTDFMNGMIDKEEDVRLLRKSGIICNRLENDAKVANLWNGMGKSVKLTRVKYLDQVIADVNKHYNRRWSVVVMKYVNKYIFSSWQFLTVLATMILLLLTCLEAFCSVYDCKKWLNDTHFVQD